MEPLRVVELSGGVKRHKIYPPGDIFDHPSCERSSSQTKLAHHVWDHVVLSLEGAVLWRSPGVQSSNPPLSTLEQFLSGVCGNHLPRLCRSSNRFHLVENALTDCISLAVLVQGISERVRFPLSPPCIPLYH